MENKPNISSEEVAKSLKIDIAIAFPQLKRILFVWKLDTWVLHSMMNKHARIPAVIPLLLRHEKTQSLDLIVTRDDKCFVYDNVWRKRHRHILSC